jgi:putative endonuclease
MEPTDGPSDPRLGLGADGERAALREYLRAGYREVARNWRCSIGEVDLIVARADLLVFCEVKTRRGTKLGAPFEAVTPLKQRRVRRLAEAFLLGWRGHASRVRLDVASVTVHAGSEPHVHVFEDAF